MINKEIQIQMKDHILVVGRHGLFYSNSVLEKVENGEWGEEGSFGGQMRCHQESVCVAHKRHLLNSGIKYKYK